MDWEAITPQLRQKLDPKNVRPAPKGKYGDYIEGWHAIAEANAIFGFGGWSYRIDDLDEAMRELVWLETNKGEKYQQWRVAHVCRITVTVGDVTRQDVGTGQGQAKPNALGDAIDSSAKEAVTDALKRALRSFGNRFGLALYDKTKANVGVDEPEDDVKPDEASGRAAPKARTLTKNEGEAILMAIDGRASVADLDEYMAALRSGPMGFAAEHPKIAEAYRKRRALIIPDGSPFGLPNDIAAE